MADFIKALTQKQVHRIPTPMMTDVSPPVPTPAEPPAQEDEAINARKAFWAKFKRAKSDRNLEESDGQVKVDDTASILSKPTLVLGETEEEPAEVVNSSIVPPPPEPVKEPDFVELALVAVEELSKPSKKEMMRVRFSKMDDVELQRALTKIRNHSFYPKFSISKEGAAVVGKGIVDELACFFFMLEHRNDPCPNMPPNVPTPPASKQLDQPTPETPKPSNPEAPSPVLEMPAPKDPEKPDHDEPLPAPPAASGESMVATALKRIPTVDLENGRRPPQSLLGKSDPPPQTVVLMNQQPVALPLTPEQCVAAGLVLAHPPHESEQKTLPPVPVFTETKKEPTLTGHAHDDGGAHDDGHDRSTGALREDNNAEDKQLMIGVNTVYCFDMYNRIQYAVYMSFTCTCI